MGMDSISLFRTYNKTTIENPNRSTTKWIRYISQSYIHWHYQSWINNFLYRCFSFDILDSTVEIMIPNYKKPIIIKLAQQINLQFAREKRVHKRFVKSRNIIVIVWKMLFRLWYILNIIYIYYIYYTYIIHNILSEPYLRFEYNFRFCKCPILGVRW